MPKKLEMISNTNQFDEFFFGPNSIFCNFKNDQKSIFEVGKSLKLPEMEFHEKNFWFIWFHYFFCLDVFKYSGPLCILQSLWSTTHTIVENISKKYIVFRILAYNYWGYICVEVESVHSLMHFWFSCSFFTLSNTKSV